MFSKKKVIPYMLLPSLHITPFPLRSKFKSPYSLSYFKIKSKSTRNIANISNLPQCSISSNSTLDLDKYCNVDLLLQFSI